MEEKLNSLFFRDQKNALAFGTEVLGFEKKAEIFLRIHLDGKLRR